MKIGLILPGNIWFCPYVNIYTDVLKKNDIDFEIISWNRDGTESSSDNSFDYVVKKQSRFDKFLPFFKYAKFIKNLIYKKKYDKLIVFGPQLGIFLYYFLRKNYKKKFILDYRDLSIEQLPVFKNIFKKITSISGLNVISSNGFKKYLPEANYIVSHNLDINKLFEEEGSSTHPFKNQNIDVLTIGSIRDYESNLELLKSLANKDDIRMYFVGKGDVSILLEKFSIENKIKNVNFHGFYKKIEEKDFIKNSNFLNIYYPQKKSHSSALSNRFYNALLYKKPMIVTSNSAQGYYVEKFNLGISIENCNNLHNEILKYKNTFNQNEFNRSCEFLLKEFESDYENFYKKILFFLKD